MTKLIVVREKDIDKTRKELYYLRKQRGTLGTAEELRKPVGPSGEGEQPCLTKQNVQLWREII